MDDRIAEIREALAASYAQGEKVKARLEQTCFNREDMPADIAMMFHADVGILWAVLQRHLDAAREHLALLDSDALIIRRDENGEWPEWAKEVCLAWARDPDTADLLVLLDRLEESQ